MIKLNYRHLNNPNFTNALGKLARCTELPIKVAYNVGKLYEKMQKELVAGHKLFQTNLIEKYAERDADGKLKEGEQPGSYPIAEGKKAEFDKAYEEMMEIEVTFDYYPVPMSAVEHAMNRAKDDKLSGKDLAMLDPILVQDMEEAPAGASGPQLVKR